MKAKIILGITAVMGIIMAAVFCASRRKKGLTA